jgi:hypothetical protein
MKQKTANGYIPARQFEQQTALSTKSRIYYNRAGVSRIVVGYLLGNLLIASAFLSTPRFNNYYYVLN